MTFTLQRKLLTTVPNNKFNTAPFVLDRRCFLLPILRIIKKSCFGACMKNLKKKFCAILFFAIFLHEVVWQMNNNPDFAKSVTSREVVVEAPRIALTFDDGPHAIFTEQLLDGLKEKGVVATFFLLGCNIEGNEEIVSRMQKEGHLIGNHTDSHVQLTLLDSSTASEEISSTNMKIFNITGHMPEYIRPPFGCWNESIATNIDMTAVLWDIDPLDWKGKNTERIVSYICHNAEDGDIILLHDVYKTSVEAALEVVDYFKERGFEFVTVEELLLE